MRVRAADVAEQRQLRGIGGRLRDRQRDTQDRVAPQPGLVGGAVEVYQRLIDQPLIVGVQADDRRADLVEDGLYRVFHTLSAVTIAAVA